MPTSSQPDSIPSARLARLAQLGAELHANSTESAVWAALEQTLADFFGHSLFTVLAFTEQGDVTRLYSTNTDLHPLGTRKSSPTADYDRDNVETPPPPPCREAWCQQVLVDGNVWRGSVREDLKAAFEDWEQLWQAGLGSVMNIPVRLNGVTIGSLNILDKEHGYDTADLKLCILIAQIVACFIHRVAGETVKKQLSR
ncbi:hypothetical protein BGW36DRAFT_389950 [Talaromyces proteolyticus]|uniref:GAF domain-containing protein n=1 Tax=Talaromyces proteolyticus TaxID=1131652 RepID=A0AAD4PUA6_9EURO|nr:uncharacterized protein BGW36DRAFT_389950 [Talaromyces proteolyticus]KAH8689922.1 hypothetical protein BGW36DRAFT_389950 [Talaromyces proteolyticus]